jgi:superfamily II RNA helicase
MNKVDQKQDGDICEKEEKSCNRLVEILDAKNQFKGENYDSLTRIYKKYKLYNQRNGKKLLNDVVEYLEKKDLVPAIFFVFSRKKCELYAKYIEKNMNNHEENAAIKKIVNYYIHQLDNPKDYIDMEQYQNMMKYLEKGICIHHSGLIPVFKEIIEILFSKNLIKVLFATETFAVGVNMPTKTVLFTSLSKYDSYQNNFRTLLTHEYLQMSGRAGRRGLDTKGIVIHLPNLSEPLDKSSMQMMMTGRTQEIVSKFGLNYQFILKMILTEQTNLMNFIETSLMNKDINESKQAIKYELDSLQLMDSTYDNELMQEYDGLLNPDPFFKMSNKQIKKNRARVQEIQKIPNFREDYKSYLEFKKQMDHKILLEKELDFYQNIINNDIMKIVSYLRKYDYLTNDTMEPESVSVKGIIASQINDCNPILFTEILTNNLLDELSVPELAAVLSMFSESKDEDEIEENNNLGLRLNERIQAIEKLVVELDQTEYEMGLNINSEWTLNKKDLNIAYQWASEKTLQELDMTVYEGNFIKDMIKINNLAENVGKMAGILGKNDLVEKASALQTVMMRDIVNVESLYIKID